MAKIFLIARDRNPTVESMIENLETEQQPLYLHLTTEATLKSLVMIWASYMRLTPDLVYFILEDENLNWVEKTLVETIGSIPHQNTAVTFVGLVNAQKSNLIRRFLKRVDLLTLPSRQNLADLRGLNSNSRRQMRTLLAPLASLHIENKPLSESEQDVLKYVNDQKLWVLPWNDQYFERYKSFLSSVAKEKTWLFLTDRSGWKFKDFEYYNEITQSWKNKPLWLNPSNDHALLEIFKNAEVLQLADLECRPTEFVKYSSLAATAGLYTLLDTHQIELLSSLWSVGENCTLLQKDHVKHELENRLVSGSLIPAQIKKRPRSPSKALDESLNELNRWITKTIALRRTGEA